MITGMIIFGIFAHLVWWAADHYLQEAKRNKDAGLMILSWFVIFCYPCLYWLCVVRMVFLPLKDGDMIIREIPQKPVAIKLENE